MKCGESHSACVTDGGFLLTFGSGRHGKLGHGQENLSNLFCPTRVERFSRFHVQKVRAKRRRRVVFVYWKFFPRLRVEDVTCLFLLCHVVILPPPPPPPLSLPPPF